MFYIRLFKNDNKTNDKQPIYGNSNFTVQEKIVLEPGVPYQVGMWKDKKNENALNIRVDEKRDAPPRKQESNEPEIDIPF